VHAEGWSKGHVCGLTGYKCSFTEANLDGWKLEISS